VTLPVVFTIAARAEIIVARDWYEARRQGLALQFDAELEAVIVRISESPLQFRLVHKEARRAMLRRFPYGVFFRVLSDRVQVIACLHTSRDPHRWQGRV
jgi:plasmid stabilization system protein ParE